MTGPSQANVDAVRGLLDLMENFPDNDQRARYLLTCNWMRDRDAAVRAEAYERGKTDYAAELVRLADNLRASSKRAGRHGR